MLAALKAWKIETRKPPMNTIRKSASEKIEEGENRGSMNLHTLRHYHLKVACLPIPPYAPHVKFKGDFQKSEAKN